MNFNETPAMRRTKNTLAAQGLFRCGKINTMSLLGVANVFPRPSQSRSFSLPPPYLLLVYRQGLGREEGRLWGDFGVSRQLLRGIRKAARRNRQANFFL